MRSKDDDDVAGRTGLPPLLLALVVATVVAFVAFVAVMIRRFW